MKRGSVIAMSVLFSLAALAARLAPPLVAAESQGPVDRSKLEPDAVAPPRKTSTPGKPFSIQKQDQISWLVRPSGERFFSLGVCCVDPGISRAEFRTDNPGYAAWRHYPDSTQWAEATLQRLRSWGFTTIGGWSDFQALGRCHDPDIAFAPVLHIGSTAGAPWWDMWDPKITSRMEQIARDQILNLRDDPRLIGYYTDNEIGWWNAILFKMTLEHSCARAETESTPSAGFSGWWPNVTISWSTKSSGSTTSGL